MELSILLSANSIDHDSLDAIVAMISNSLVEYHPIIEVVMQRSNSVKPLNLNIDEAIAFSLLEIGKNYLDDSRALYPSVFLLHSVIRYFHRQEHETVFLESQMRKMIDQYRETLSGNPPFPNPALICNSLRLIQASNNMISLNTLAQEQNITPSYLSAAISKTDITFTDVIHYSKLLSAVSMFIKLPFSTSLETISYDVGYSSIHYFNKVFRKYIGITPGFARRTASIFMVKSHTLAVPAAV